jgi:hypothetical protein
MALYVFLPEGSEKGKAKVFARVAWISSLASSSDVVVALSVPSSLTLIDSTMGKYLLRFRKGHFYPKEEQNEGTYVRYRLVGDR